MKNKFLILMALASMLSFFACEKDETKVVYEGNPTAPVLDPVSDAVFSRDNATDSIKFSGSEADFGYKASIKYILEVAVSGTDFAEPIQLATVESVNAFAFAVGDLNTMLITVLPEDVMSSLEIRSKAVIISSETGGSDQIESNSAALPIKITTYGPPSLYLTGDANDQRLVSADDDGIYIGWVSTDGTAFTLTNKDDGKVYGATAGDVTEGGAAIALASGTHNVTVNLNTLKQTDAAEIWAIIGTATPNAWNDPDTDMDFDLDGQFWVITEDLIKGEWKFRANNSWGLNLGDNGADGELNEGGANIVLDADGEYTIKLYSNRTYSVVKN